MKSAYAALIDESNGFDLERNEVTMKLNSVVSILFGAWCSHHGRSQMHVASISVPLKRHLSLKTFVSIPPLVTSFRLNILVNTYDIGSQSRNNCGQVERSDSYRCHVF